MAENQDGQEKTEQPSAKRLNEARQRGQVSKSMDITTAVVLLGGGMTVFIVGKPLVDDYVKFMKHILMHSSLINISAQNANHYYMQLVMFLAGILLPLILIIFAMVFAAEVSQVGLKFATKKFTEGMGMKQLMKPHEGLKKVFFSQRSFVELVKSIFKLLLIGAVVYWVLSEKIETTIAMIERPFIDIAIFMVAVSFELVLKVGLAYIIIAFLDYLYQKWKFREDMKMTKQEVKEETKQSEGDPKIKGKLRSLMRNRVRGFMLKNAETADVVVTNPTHYAVALKYKQGEMNAPKVVAKGVDYLALSIREIAEKNKVPIVEEPPLARALYSSCETGDEIPENLFKAVAQILAYIYQLKANKQFIQ